MDKNYIFTSESVTEGHPDKVSDQISDAILDQILLNDPEGRVACETLTTTNLVVVSGEISTHTHPNYEEVIRKTVRKIGYEDPNLGFDTDSLKIKLFIDEQSPHIAQGVDSEDNREQGAGDQGLMFGFACLETPELMPLPIVLAHKLVEKLTSIRKNGILPWLRPDGKSQVSIEYNKFKPICVKKIVLATQHEDMLHQFNGSEEDELSFIHENLVEHVIKPTLAQYNIKSDDNYIINGTGRFVEGGPKADTGLTGRKIIVDTYGGYARHGGGAFSGKDPSKVDRSAAYMARYIAKNIVASGLAERCEVQLAYSIGVADPVSVLVETFGTGLMEDDQLISIVKNVFNLKPAGIIEALDLKKPIYTPLSAYGHFGRTNVTWEKTDKVEILKNLVKEKK